MHCPLPLRWSWRLAQYTSCCSRCISRNPTRPVLCAPTIGPAASQPRCQPRDRELRTRRFTLAGHRANYCDWRTAQAVNAVATYNREAKDRLDVPMFTLASRPGRSHSKTCCTRGAATANVHDSSLIRCCGNVDKRCKFAAQSKGAEATASRFFEDLRASQPIRKCPRCGTSKKQARGQCADCSVCPVHDPALKSKSLRKNQFEIRIMMLPNLSEAVTVFFRPAGLTAPSAPHTSRPALQL
jgi:hypothetical protein